jgi:acetyl/propionyl-CoA carboxylase alpha subunit
MIYGVNTLILFKRALTTDKGYIAGQYDIKLVDDFYPELSETPEPFNIVKSYDHRKSDTKGKKKNSSFSIPMVSNDSFCNVHEIKTNHSMMINIATLSVMQTGIVSVVAQRVIIKFLWNEKANARQIAARLQKQLTKHAYQLRTVQFWITEI